MRSLSRAAAGELVCETAVGLDHLALVEPRLHVQSRFDEREVIETYRRLAHELAGGGA